MDAHIPHTEILSRFTRLNQARLKRAYQVMTGKQQRVMDMLPLLFHINHKMLPGYVSEQTPAGVYNFQNDDHLISQAKQIAPSFQFSSTIQTKEDIDAIYLMGSCGSVAHSRLSDFDIWLCHRPTLDAEQVSDLQKKANKICKWAEDQGVELYIFVMTAEQFKANKRSGLSGEDCGSSQHKLLLDEFYRTGLVIAGKVPLWWFVSPIEDNDYENSIKRLSNSKQFHSGDILDFGSLDVIPQEEFIGAAVWQMYKAINSPYKSMLKILLSEVYASDTQTVPLAHDFKKYVYQGHLHADELDPYVMIYRRIERYLLAQNDKARLDFIQRCFYAKVGIALSPLTRDDIKHWRQQMIRNLCDQWRWGEYKLMELDERINWPIERAIEEQNILIAELQRSYQLLQKLMTQRDISQSIDPREIQILGNKLSAWYDHRNEKVQIISHAISSGAFVEKLVIKRSADNQWQLARPNSKDPIYTSNSVQQLICWSEANHLANNLTQYFVDPSCGDVQSQHIQTMRRHIQQLLSTLDKPIDDKAFTEQEHFLNCLFIIDSRETSIAKTDMLVSDRNDMLNYGGARHNLVHRVDIIVCSSWNALYCYSFSGQNSLIESLCFVVNNSLHSSCGMPEGQFTSFANQAKGLIQRYSQIYHAIDKAFFSEQNTSRFIMEIEQEYFIIERQIDEVVWRNFSNRSRLFNYLGREQKQFSPICLEHGALRDTPLAALLPIFKESLVQVFYQVNAGMAALFINDEKGAFFNYYTQFHNAQALLQPLYRFLNNIRKRQNYSQLEDGKHLYFYEIVFNKKFDRYIIDPIPTDMDIKDDHHFEVEAIAHANDTHHIVYDIVCNKKMFTFSEHGESIYRDVALYILGQRNSKQHYPIYLTDIDLSQCHSASVLQTIVYIQHKQKIERLLNHAMLDIE